MMTTQICRCVKCSRERIARGQALDGDKETARPTTRVTMTGSMVTAAAFFNKDFTDEQWEKAALYDEENEPKCQMHECQWCLRVRHEGYLEYILDPWRDTRGGMAWKCTDEEECYAFIDNQKEKVGG